MIDDLMAAKDSLHLSQLMTMEYDFFPLEVSISSLSFYMSNLWSIGITGNLWKWFSSYL